MTARRKDAKCALCLPRSPTHPHTFALPPVCNRHPPYFCSRPSTYAWHDDENLYLRALVRDESAIPLRSPECPSVGVVGLLCARRLSDRICHCHHASARAAFGCLSWRACATAVKIMKTKDYVKFKVRCSRYLYTLVVTDAEKADKLKQSLPPGARGAGVRIARPAW